MGGLVVLWLPCFGKHLVEVHHHKAGVAPLATSEDEDYFGYPAKPFFVGSEGEIYEFLGQHVFREGATRACLKDVFTGERRDLDIYEWDQMVSTSGPWNMLNPLEVLAWQAD